jgi:hypothetical protein
VDGIPDEESQTSDLESKTPVSLLC